MRYVEVFCRVLLATVFVGAVAGKVGGRSAYQGFVRSLRDMAIPNGLIRMAAPATVAAEALTAVLLLAPLRPTVLLGFILATTLLGAFAAVVGRALRRGVRAPCRCFGGSATPLGARHIIRNVILMALAGAGIAATAAGHGRLQIAPTLIAASAGLVIGLATIALDDLVSLVKTTP
jgi:hypothetical protein